LYFVIAGITVGIATFAQVSQQQVIILKSVWFPSYCISLLQVLFLDGCFTMSQLLSTV
jgi:hypothetical protein